MSSFGQMKESTRDIGEDKQHGEDHYYASKEKMKRGLCEKEKDKR